MSARRYLEALPLSDLTVYRSSAEWRKTSIRFTGNPRKHPYDRERIILIDNPFDANTVFHEFRVADITHADDLPSLCTENGESASMVHLWVRRGSLALRFQAIEVQDSILKQDCVAPRE